MRTRYVAEYHNATMKATYDLREFTNYLEEMAEQDREFAESLKLFELKGGCYYAQSLSTYKI